MNHFCPNCGKAESAASSCLQADCPLHRITLPSTKTLALPKADLSRRFGGAALEVVTFFVLDIIGALLSPFTFFVSGAFTSLMVALYVVVKDFNGGSMSVGKRVASTRLVDVSSGAPASAKQALIRNSYIVVGWICAAIPDPVGFVGWIIVAFSILVDVLMVFASPRGLRLGDRLAGTQVVPMKEVL